MSASAWTIQRVQLALKTHLVNQSFSWVVASDIVAGIHRPAQDNDDFEREVHEVPVVVCQCATAQATALHSGTWDATAIVRFECNADDYTSDQFHTMAAELMDAVCTTTIAADLTAAQSDFTAEHVNVQTQSWTIEGRKWVAELSIQVICCGQDLV